MTSRPSVLSAGVAHSGAVSPDYTRTRRINMRLVVWITSWLLVGAVAGQQGPQFISSEQTQSAGLGDTIVLQCAVRGVADHTIQWWYMDHLVQLSDLDHVTANDSRIRVTRPQGGDDHWDLRISNLRRSDAGIYQCRVGGTSLTQTSSLHIIGVPTSPPIADLPRVNFTDCCIGAGVSSPCRPVCSPSTLNFNTFDFTRCSQLDFPKLLTCGSAGRNHVPCCRQRLVPSQCLDFCFGKASFVMDGQFACLAWSRDIMECFEEGQHLLPSPPLQLSVYAKSSSVLHAQWLPPVENSGSLSGYRVLYRRASDDKLERSHEVQSGWTLEHDLTQLESSTLYEIRVVAFNEHGASLPSYGELVSTLSRNPLPPGVTQATFQQCCQDRGVRPECQPLLCGEGALPDSQATIMDCYSEVDKVFACMSGERNHTACCEQQGLDPSCMGLCAGKLTHLDEVHCITLLPHIGDCFNDNALTIASSPRNVHVVGVTYTTADVTWDAPQDNANLILAYQVRYWREGHALAYSQMTTTELHTSLYQLQSGAAYHIEVLAASAEGVSLPSPTITLITNDPSDSVTTRPNSPLMPYNVSACCIDSQIKAECLPLCSYNFDFRAASVETLLMCEAELGVMFKCGADGRNHTSCCSQRAVPDTCLEFCGFTDHMADTFVFEWEHVDCVAWLADVTYCMQEGLATLPKSPREVTVESVTRNTIKLVWGPPSVSADIEINGYEVRWSPTADPSTWNRSKTDVAAYTIHNLLADTEYHVLVHTYNSFGDSVPAPGLFVRTAPEDLPLNVTLAADLTSCCLAHNVSQECFPACTGNAVVNLHRCDQELPSLVQCAADDRNHTDCCVRRHLPAHCLPLCRGEPVDTDFMHLICYSFMDHIFSCFRDGYYNLPSSPQYFHAMKIGSLSIDVAWTPPAKNPSGVRYDVWYKNALSSEYVVVQNATSPYHMAGLQPQLTYTVFVVAVNGYGASQPTPILEVFTLPNNLTKVSILQDPAADYVKEGSHVVLTCQTSGVTEPVVEWIRQAARLSTAEPGVIDFRSVSAEDTGRYTCVVSSATGTVSASHILNVQYGPLASAGMKEILVAPGAFMTAQLKCIFHGFPEEIEWSHNGQLVPDPAAGGRYMRRRELQEDEGIIISHLDIQSVAAEDYGTYLCTGSNAFGEQSDSISLRDINGGGMFDVNATAAPSVPDVRSCCLRHNVQDMCLAVCSFDVDLTQLMTLDNPLACMADAPTMIACAADGRDHRGCCQRKRVPEACLPFCLGQVNDPVWTNQSLCLGHIGEIVDCMEEGHDTIPSAPRGVRGSLRGGYIRVSWEMPEKNRYKVDHYDVLYKALGDNNPPRNYSTNHTVRSVDLNAIHSLTTYTITVVARNHHGASHPSRAITIDTYEMPPSVPRSLHGLVLHGVDISLTWRLPLEFPGAVISYNVFFGETGKNQFHKNNTKEATVSYVLRDLAPQTNYSVYLTALSSNYESEPSNTIAVKTGDLEFTEPEAHDRGNLVVVPVLSVLIVLAVLIAVGLFLFCYFRIRHVPHTRFKDSVSFENPGYATAGESRGEARAYISGLPPDTSSPGSATDVDMPPTNGKVPPGGGGGGSSSLMSEVKGGTPIESGYVSLVPPGRSQAPDQPGGQDQPALVMANGDSHKDHATINVTQLDRADLNGIDLGLSSTI